MKKPRASIVSISYDPTAGDVKKTLKVLETQSFLDFEYVLVDSGKKAISTKTLEKSPLYNLIHTKSVFYKEKSDYFNYAAAYNEGISYAKGEIIIRLSGDAIPIGKDWVQNLVSPFKKKKIGIATGKDIIKSQLAFNEFFLNDLYKRTFISIITPKKKELYKNLPLINGPCMAFRKSLWNRHRFNEQWLWGEEIEFAFWALQRKYYLLFDPGIGVLHSHDLDVSQTLKRIMNDAQTMLKTNELIRQKLSEQLDETIKRSMEIPYTLRKRGKQYYSTETLKFRKTIKLYIQHMNEIRNQFNDLLKE